MRRGKFASTPEALTAVRESVQAVFEKNEDLLFEAIWKNEALRKQIFEKFSHSESKIFFKDMIKDTQEGVLYNIIQIR